MLRLLQIEWIKVKSNTSFWILLFLYAAGVYVACSLGKVLLEANITTQSNGDIPPEIPIINLYDFPSIWHNLTYIGSYLRIFLGIIVITSIANEKAYRTLRQNIIDGMSKQDFLISKLLYVFVLAICATLFLTGVTLFFGYTYSEETSFSLVTENISFVGAYFLQILTFMAFSMLMALFFKSSGLAIVFTIIYSFFLETFFAWIFLDTDGVIVSLLPIHAMDNLIRFPFNPFNPESVQTQVETVQVFIAAGWLVITAGLSYLILKKKDL